MSTTDQPPVCGYCRREGLGDVQAVAEVVESGCRDVILACGPCAEEALADGDSVAYPWGTPTA